MREAHKRGENLGLTDDELALYDALEVNDSAVKVLGDETPSAPSPVGPAGSDRGTCGVRTCGVRLFF